MRRKDLLTVFCVSIVFAFLHGIGVYGYGSDFHASYIELTNNSWGGITDFLGWRLATFTLYEIRLGVYLSSFLAASSLGLLVYKISDIYGIRNRLYIFLAYVLIINSWPVMMSTSQAMRQGIMMSFIFFSMYCYLSGARYRSLLFCFLAFFSHKSSVYFLILFAMVILMDRLSMSRRVDLNGHFPAIVFAVLATLGALLLVPYVFGSFEASPLIGRDFRILFLSINLLYILFFCLLGREKLDIISRYLLLFSMTSPVFLFYGMNSQYERLNQIMILPFIFVFSQLFTRKARSLYLLTTSGVLFALTMITGMYASFS